MFFHKKTEAKWPMLFFILIVIAVIVLTVGVLVLSIGKFRNKNLDKKGYTDSQQREKVTVEIHTPESVAKNYLAEINKMIGNLETADSFEQEWAGMEKNFFTLRVPQEKLDVHLSVFLQLQKMPKNGKDNKEKALELLRTLVD